MWMNWVNKGCVLPPPYNLIPNPKAIFHWFRRMRDKYRGYKQVSLKDIIIYNGGVFFRSPHSEKYLSLVALLHHSFSFVIITSYVFVVCCHDVCHQ